MATATATIRKPATRKATPKRADVCRLSLTINGVMYALRPVPAPAFGHRKAFRLRKADGTAYDVADTLHGPTCDCGDQTFRHEGRDDRGCKHIRRLEGVRPDLTATTHAPPPGRRRAVHSTHSRPTGETP